MRLAAAKTQSRSYDIADLVGCIDGLPADLGARKKHYLRLGWTLGGGPQI
jgi:hypothetical protein